MRRRLQEDKSHPNDPTKGNGHAEDKGSFKTTDGKTVEHEELFYVVPPQTKISQCKKENQAPIAMRTSPDACADYVKKGWNGFETDKAKQQAAYPNLNKFASDKKLSVRFWGRDIDQIKEYSSDPTLPDYVYEIGLCTSKLWSQNLVNNKIIMNKQITDYDDIIYTQCAKYDVLARSCLMGGPKIDKNANTCYKYYASMAARVGEYTNMKLRRAQQQEQLYDDTTTKQMLDGRTAKTRKGKYFRKSTDKLKKEIDNKVDCMKKVLDKDECFLFRNMMPSALQSEIQEVTFLHKTEKVCPPCEPCPKCPGCVCKKCACRRLTSWELNAIHKVIYNAKDGDVPPITTGVNCDVNAFKPLSDKITANNKLGTEVNNLLIKKANQKKERILAEEGEYYN